MPDGPNHPGAPSTFEADLAETLDAEPELLPHLPWLLADLEDLGARSSDVVAVLTQGGLGPRSRVLDLGCGKGAAAIAVAEAYGARVRGVDGLPSFVEHARSRAAARGITDRCAFDVGDVRDVVRSARDYDLVMLLALGPVLGELDETIARLRRCVRPGGLLLVDDAYLPAGEPIPEGARACYDRATLITLLESQGDRLVAEHPTDTPEGQAWLREATANILDRARELSERHPTLGEQLLEFAARQQRETSTLASPLVGALWLVEVS